jgi:hypothetical protein
VGNSGSDAPLVDEAADRLRRRLPPGWTIELSPPPGTPDTAGSSATPDLIIHSAAAGSQTSMLVEARREFSPRDADSLVTSPLLRRLRDRAGRTPILVVAPYLSAQTRARLAADQISYLDLTGNVRVVLDHPGLFIEADGAEQDPRGSTRPRPGLRGAKVGALVRVLVDHRPPYTGAQAARTAGINEGYASRIFETLSDGGLIQRSRSGMITEVDWPELIRRRADALTLFGPSGTHRYVAREGALAALSALARVRTGDPRPVVTGSFAAERLAQVAAPAQLVVYTMSRARLAEILGLIEVESGADVVLIRPDNDIVFRETQEVDGVAYAATSQVAIDCLAGSGRMPAEGEAVLAWMVDHEDRWRAQLSVGVA